MSLNVLIVDDDAPTVNLLIEVLKSLGAEATGVTDSQLALELMQRQKFDGIIIDVVMPGMNGIELTSAIRTSRMNSKTPIIAISGSENQKTMESSMKAGATFFLHKPFDRASILRGLNSTRGSMLQEQRRYVRVPLRTVVRGIAGNVAIQGTARDISEGGMCFVSTAPLRPKTRVTVQCELPGIPDHFEAQATVVRITDDPLICVQFDQLSEAKRDGVRIFVAKHLSKYNVSASE